MGEGAGFVCAAANHSISLSFHCAVAWPPWPLWPPVVKICSISPRDRVGGFRPDKTPICGCGALALVVLGWWFPAAGCFSGLWRPCPFSYFFSRPSIDHYLAKEF